MGQLESSRADFAEDLIREEKYLRELPNLIKYTAYNIEYVKRACECLWELGKEDCQKLNEHPGHAIRILAELCSIEPNKPIQYNEIVVNFALDLLEDKSSFNYHHTPFDILKGILQTEGHTTISNKANLVFEPYLVPAGFVSELRNKVIVRAINLLAGDSVKISILAAQFLHSALRYPMGMFNTSVPPQITMEWTKEFVNILEQIEFTTKSHDLDPLVLIEIIKSTSWHAHYAAGITAPIAKRLIEALPTTLEFRTTLALIDGSGILFEHRDYEKHQEEWNQYLSHLTSDLISAYPEGEKLRTFIEKILSNIEKDYQNRDRYPNSLYWNLIQTSSLLAIATVDNALVSLESKTNKYVDISLSVYSIHFEQSFQRLEQSFQS